MPLNGLTVKRNIAGVRSIDVLRFTIKLFNATYLLIGMRNRLTHGYFDIDLDRVRDTVLEDLEPLYASLEKMVDMS